MDLSALQAWWSTVDVGRSALLIAAVVAGLLLLGWARRRLRGPKIAKVDGDDGRCGICARIAGALSRLFEAIDYLATSREWRYRQPWILVLGERGAGKSSLLASVSTPLQHRAPPRADELEAEGMQWRFFRDGVLIDSDGALATAAPGSAEAAKWKRGLNALDALRPERPLDGVLLCVSATALRRTGRASREALAVETARQLEELQTRIDFVLPIYVVVTRCDEIPGFAAFWRNFDLARHGDMFGYSAEGGDQSDPPDTWAETACDRISARLRELQVNVAAHREDLVQADDFFLFPAHFRALREPLGQWLETVFKPSAWQSAHLFRGVYFTGAVESDGERGDGVRKDVDFVDALVAEKALREIALARPTRRGTWSRNTLIRRMQYAGVLGLLGMFVALGAASMRLSHQVNSIVTGLDKLVEVAPHVPPANSGECLGVGDVYPLLSRVAQVRTDSRYPAIPLSWIDRRLTTRTALVVGKSSVEDILMPTLSCRLELRARDLLAASARPRNAGGDGLEDEQTAFRDLVVSARELEDNLHRYRTLAGDSGELSEAELIATLDALSRYAFGEPLPKAVRRRGNVLDDAFRSDLHLPMPVMPNGLQMRLATAIRDRSADLRGAISREVGAGDDLVLALGRGDPPVLANTRRLGAWMTWVQGEWLASTAARNPCQSVIGANERDIRALIAYYGEPEPLVGVLRKFDERECHRPEMRTLAEMQLPPYGPMFVSDGKGLKMTADLRRELEGLPALVRMPYMQLRTTAPFQCVGTAVTWRAQEIAEAAGYLEQYRGFARTFPPPQLPEGGMPLYERLARHSLAAAMDDALRRAQQAPADAVEAVDAAVPTDARVAAVGGELARGLAPLLEVLGAYESLGFPDNGATVRQCARNFASDHLGSVDALADASRLYAPPLPATGEDIYAFGGLPVTRDFLQRQVGRAQVLGSYAQPFLDLLAGTAGVDDAWRDAPQTANYWRNTLDELARYTKGKEPAGQVANLDAYFIGQLTGMTYANCGSVLAAYRSPETGDDLFSARRRTLEAQVRLRCTDRRRADAGQLYSDLAARFNRDLAGRYPFGAMDARDASPAAVRAFFLDYGGRRAQIVEAVRGLGGDDWRAAAAFLDELDRAAAFFGPNLAAPEETAAIGIRAQFPAESGRSVGADQIVRWRLSADLLDSIFPNALTDLPWYPGEAVALELHWAARSDWRPVADPPQSGLRVGAGSARFGEDGAWALLRFLDRHRMPSAAARDGGSILLRFAVPVQRVAAPGGGTPTQPPQTAETVVFASVRLTGTDPASKAERTIELPVRFPRSAPEPQ
jgi:type VI secretion system protein ImpL